MNVSLLKRPTAFLPLAMSLTVLAMLLGTIAASGGTIQREADEGTIAHLFQILMAAQVPIIAFFAIKWMPRAPQQAITILALQVVAALAAMAPVLLLGL
jgi:hypothetical protein